MKNTCPQCGTAYNVTPSAIGRKVTCKNCGAQLVVTEAGLEFQTPPGSTAAPAAGAFDFDAPRGEEDASRKSKPAKTGKTSRRDEYPDGDEENRRGRRRKDKPEDEEDDRPRRKAKKTGGKNFVSDFLFFREFIAPWVVKILFWIALVGLLLGSVVVFIGALVSGKVEIILATMAGIVILVPVYMLLIRIWAELILLGFAVYDRLGEIRDQLPKREPPPASETQ
jgi:predicted Zn finger-like uncharacterized protein